MHEHAKKGTEERPCIVDCIRYALSLHTYIWDDGSEGVAACRACGAVWELDEAEYRAPRHSSASTPYYRKHCHVCAFLIFFIHSSFCLLSFVRIIIIIILFDIILPAFFCIDSLALCMYVGTQIWHHVHHEWNFHLSTREILMMERWLREEDTHSGVVVEDLPRCVRERRNPLARLFAAYSSCHAIVHQNINQETWTYMANLIGDPAVSQAILDLQQRVTQALPAPAGNMTMEELPVG